MTIDEAKKALAEHELNMRLLFAAVGMETMIFAKVGASVEKALDTGNALATAVEKSMKLWTQGGSDYLAALENARKGMLAPVDEWQEVFGDE
jgi:hypothetical protein